MTRSRFKKTIPEWRVPTNNNMKVNKGKLWKDNPCCPEVIRKQIKKMELARRYETYREETV